MRLILHAFEHTPLLNNVEEEFGNRSSFESQRVRVQANMADLNSVLAQGEKERPLCELCFSQWSQSAHPTGLLSVQRSIHRPTLVDHQSWVRNCSEDPIMLQDAHRCHRRAGQQGDMTNKQRQDSKLQNQPPVGQTTCCRRQPTHFRFPCNSNQKIALRMKFAQRQ